MEEQDAELVEATLAGDLECFGRLAKRYYTALAAIAYSQLHDRHLAEDAAQEALSRALIRLGTLRRKDRVGYWLGRICRNVARDMGRTRPIATDGAAAVDPADTQSNKSGDVEAVRRAVARLSPAAQELITLRYFDGCSYGQIGAVTGLSGPAINGRLLRAKRKIARLLEREGYAGNKS